MAKTKRRLGAHFYPFIPLQPRSGVGEYAPGELICDQYKVKLLLGRGGMGEVYLVEHSASGEIRAAKVLRARDDVSDFDLVGFRQEAIFLLNMGAHPFVVRLFEVHEHARDTVLIMEYVAPVSGCTTIADYIERTQDYSDYKIGVWAVQFCRGMEHALSSGVSAHRDIKPGNLLVDSGVFLKIADFGIASAASSHPMSVHSANAQHSQLRRLVSEKGQVTCGTPGYVAPELYVGGRASAQSDMFGFGVTLWQLAARSLESPYGVRFEGDMRKYQAKVLQRALVTGVRQIDSPYFEVIFRCLAADPADRYSDFSELCEAIKGAAKRSNLKTMDVIVDPMFRGSFNDFVSRGRAYMALGRHERALAILDRAVAYKSANPEALLARAEALCHRGKFLPAIRDYEAAHHLDPQSDAPLTGLAMAWLDIGDTAQAREALATVISRHPGNMEARLLVARADAEEGDAESALSEIESLLASDPHNWRAHDHYGCALRQKGKAVEAAKAFSACLRINPLALGARLDLASLLDEQNEKAAAQAEYQHSIRLFQDSPEDLNMIGAHMAENGRESEAIELFRSIAESQPDSRSMMMVNIGNAQLQLGDRCAAIESFERAITLDTSNALAYSRLGDVEEDVARYDKAAAQFVRACALDTRNAAYQASAGTAYLRQGNFDRAAAHLRRSIDLYPEQPHIFYNLAVALVSNGDAEAAVEELHNAVRVDEEYARAWYLKAQLESHLGRQTDATVSAGRAAAHGSNLTADELEGVRALLQG